MCIVFAACPSGYVAAQEVKRADWTTPVETAVKDSSEGSVYIRGTVILPASRLETWNVLTDYDSLEKFIPNMLDAAIISGEGNTKVVNQKGMSRFWIFGKTVEVTLDIQEFARDSMIFNLRRGPFHEYSGRWDLFQDTGNNTTQLIFRALIKPDFYAPKFIIRRVIRNDFRSSLDAIRNEVLRRYYR